MRTLKQASFPFAPRHQSGKTRVRGEILLSIPDLVNSRPMDSSKPQTILITGGGGFVGNILAAELLKQPDLQIQELVLCDIVEPRDPVGFENDRRLTKVKTDLADPAAVEALFEGKTYTVICALHGLMCVYTSFHSGLRRCNVGVEAQKPTLKAGSGPTSTRRD